MPPAGAAAPAAPSGAPSCVPGSPPYPPRTSPGARPRLPPRSRPASPGARPAPPLRPGPPSAEPGPGPPRSPPAPPRLPAGGTGSLGAPRLPQAPPAAPAAPWARSLWAGRPHAAPALLARSPDTRKLPSPNPDGDAAQRRCSEVKQKSRSGGMQEGKDFRRRKALPGAERIPRQHLHPSSSKLNPGRWR